MVVVVVVLLLFVGFENLKSAVESHRALSAPPGKVVLSGGPIGRDAGGSRCFVFLVLDFFFFNVQKNPVRCGGTCPQHLSRRMANSRYVSRRLWYSSSNKQASSWLEPGSVSSS